MICPAHNTAMERTQTRFGVLYVCKQPDCTVQCWGGATSTPADQATRDLRKRCHEVFDRLWQERGLFASRTAAYRWLAKRMEMSPRHCHIGAFDASQCRRVLALIGQGEGDRT